MTDDDRRMVETLLVAQVLLLERELAREARRKGVRRIGGDYVGEAAREISRKRGRVLQALGLS